MNNACPECGAVYSVAEKDIGRRIACKRCATALVVGEEGLKREPLETATVANEEPLPRRERDRDDDEPRTTSRGRSRDRDDEDDERPSRRAAKSNAPKISDILTKLKGMGDLATWLYGIGLFFVVYSYFSPMMDKGTHESRQGYVEYLLVQNEQKDREDKAKNNGNLSEGRIKAQKEFREKEMEPAEDDVKLAKASARRAEWWNVIYRMFGFVIIAFGSLGFMSAQQPMLQRVVGGGTLLLVLLQVIGGGAVLNVGLGGRPG